MENGVPDQFIFEPVPGTVPYELDLSLMANGSIPEELPVDNQHVAEEPENLANGDSSYESADDLPDKSDSMKDAITSDADPSAEVARAASELERFSRLRKLLFGIAILILLLSVSVAVWYKMDGSVTSVGQNFTSENNITSQNVSNS